MVKVDYQVTISSFLNQEKNEKIFKNFKKFCKTP